MNKQILIDDFIEKHPEYKGKKLEVLELMIEFLLRYRDNIKLGKKMARV